MARYIDADKLKEEISQITVTVMGGRSCGKTIFEQALNSYREEVLKRTENAPTADVVPKSEVKQLDIPCKIGDEVWAIRNYGGAKIPRKAQVTEMYYVGEEMKLCIVVKNIGRGEWMKTVFPSYEEAQKRLNK